MFGNPYTPGAGCVPPFLAGRDPMLHSAQTSLEQLKNGYPQRPTLYYGLRGVGKTALLNEIEGYADNLDILYTHIEATEGNLFIKRLIASLSRFAKSISKIEVAKSVRDKCIKLIDSFSVTYGLIDNTVSLSVSPDEVVSTGVLSDDLTEIFVSLGRIAMKSNDAICIFIDEFQFLQPDQIRGVVSALHRCNQLRLPITIWCAGLPKALELLNRTLSYSERLFEYILLDKLPAKEAADAIAEPAKRLGIEYESAALKEIIDTSDGYPYFIQEYCSVIWNSLDNDTKVISHNAVLSSRKEFFDRLDSGFFNARYSRCSASEKKFMLAMAECGDMPCMISDIAAKLGKNVQQVSPNRATLIDKGFVYAPARCELAFTVPLFAGYIKRATNDD